MGKLDGQVAVVMGASSGMGWQTALAFAAEGARVVAVARRRELLDGLVAAIAERGGHALAQAGDVSRRTDVDAAAQAAVERFGRVDVLAYTAGVNTRERELAVVSQEQWDRVVGVNLSGAFYCMQAVLPQMRRQGGGLIILISSISAIWGDFSGPAYQASKHGLVGLANATMMEERLNGIRVTVIFPGLCDTPLLSNRPMPPTRETRDKMMKPEDIAQACVFVASLPPRTYVAELVIMPGALQCNGHPVAG